MCGVVFFGFFTQFQLERTRKKKSSISAWCFRRVTSQPTQVRNTDPTLKREVERSFTSVAVQNQSVHMLFGSRELNFRGSERPERQKSHKGADIVRIARKGV